MGVGWELVTNVRALSQLAALAVDAGQTAEAESALDQILVHTGPEPADATIRFPGVKSDDSSRIQATYLATVRQRRVRPTAEAMRALRGFWLEDPPEAMPAGDRDVRQRAIRDLGALVAAKNDAKALAQWTARWRAADIPPTEKLLALYAAGATDALLDEVEALRVAKPADPQITNAFIWLALQSGEFDRLGSDHNRNVVARMDGFEVFAHRFDIRLTLRQKDPVRRRSNGGE